jgi:hypothetical protein
MTIDYFSFLGCDAASLVIYSPTFRKNELPSSSVQAVKVGFLTLYPKAVGFFETSVTVYQVT